MARSSGLVPEPQHHAPWTLNNIRCSGWLTQPVFNKAKWTTNVSKSGSQTQSKHPISTHRTIKSNWCIDLPWCFQLKGCRSEKWCGYINCGWNYIVQVDTTYASTFREHIWFIGYYNKEDQLICWVAMLSDRGSKSEKWFCLVNCG